MATLTKTEQGGQLEFCVISLSFVKHRFQNHMLRTLIYDHHVVTEYLITS